MKRSQTLLRMAMELGRLLHRWQKHLANTEGPEILSLGEREGWESCQRKREEFIKGWTGNSQEPFSSVREERLWLRKGIRPLLSGKPDEILRQGKRAAVLDYKFGSYRVANLCDNIQLSIYALLVARSLDVVEEVTCQILSSSFDFEPFTYSREELDRLYQSLMVVVASLADPGDPAPGDHCHFCPARLICGTAREQAESAMLTKIALLHQNPANPLWNACAGSVRHAHSYKNSCDPT